MNFLGLLRCAVLASLVIAQEPGRGFAAVPDPNAALIGARFVLVQGEVVGTPFARPLGPITAGSLSLMPAGSRADERPEAVASVPIQNGSFVIDEGSYETVVNGRPVVQYDIPDGSYDIWVWVKGIRNPLIPENGRVTIVRGRTITFGKQKPLNVGAYSIAAGAAVGPTQTVFFASDRTVAIEVPPGTSQNIDVGALFSFAPERAILPCDLVTSVPTPDCAMTYGQLVPRSGPQGVTYTRAATSQDLISMISAPAAPVSRVVIFVHGYNQDFTEPWSVGAQVVANFDTHVPVIVYSWPSTHQTVKYFDDEANNTWDADHFLDFLTELLTAPNAPQRIDIIAHSMGNRLVVGSLDTIYREHLQTAGGSGANCTVGSDDYHAVKSPCHYIGQVVFAAADVDRATFYDALPRMASVARGLTIYGSKNDKALLLSRDVHGHCRAGLTHCDPEIVFPNAIANVNIIDASIFACDFFDHGYWSASSTMQADIAAIFASGTMESADAPRPNLARVTSNEQDQAHYRFYQIPSSDAQCGGG